jgi:hypothetical protein
LFLAYHSIDVRRLQIAGGFEVAESALPYKKEKNKGL